MAWGIPQQGQSGEPMKTSWVRQSVQKSGGRE
jgi:hypothetical protein